LEALICKTSSTKTAVPHAPPPMMVIFFMYNLRRYEVKCLQCMIPDTGPLMQAFHFWKNCNGKRKEISLNCNWLFPLQQHRTGSHHGIFNQINGNAGNNRIGQKFYQIYIFAGMLIWWILTVDLFINHIQTFFHYNPRSYRT